MESPRSTRISSIHEISEPSETPKLARGAAVTRTTAIYGRVSAKSAEEFPKETRRRKPHHLMAAPFPCKPPCKPTVCLLGCLPHLAMSPRRTTTSESEVFPTPFDRCGHESSRRSARLELARDVDIPMHFPHRSAGCHQHAISTHQPTRPPTHPMHLCSQPKGLRAWNTQSPKTTRPMATDSSGRTGRSRVGSVASPGGGD